MRIGIFQVAELSVVGRYVEAILNRSKQTANYSSADFLAHEGAPTFIDAQHAIAQNKIMIVDGEVVLTGYLISPWRRKRRTLP